MPSQKNFSLTNIQLGEIINPLSSANGINLTASATVGGIISSTSTVYKNTTNSFSFGGIFSLPLWTTATVLRSCLSAGTGYQLEVVGTTGKFKVTLNATVYESSIPGGGSLAASNLEAGSTHKILAIVTVGTSTTTVSFYIDGYLLNTTAAQSNVDVTNTNIYYTGGLVTTRYAMTVYDIWDYNRSLDSDDVLDLYNNGIHFSDKWGSQTPITSGTLETGKNYIIDTYVAGDDFTNIGGTNVSGSEFTATGTTPTTWTNSSSLRRTGAILSLESPSIQPAPGQWLDSSTNKLHALQPLTGSSLTLPKRDFQVRGTVTWSGTHELKHITVIDRAVLPPNAYIESIIGVITGSTIEDIQIGDGSDGDRFVVLTTGLSTGTVTFTIANHIPDGTNYKLTVDPDANFTGSIAFTIKGYITS
jgi:hypothetical protein